MLSINIKESRWIIYLSVNQISYSSFLQNSYDMIFVLSYLEGAVSVTQRWEEPGTKWKWNFEISLQHPILQTTEASDPCMSFITDTFVLKILLFWKSKQRGWTVLEKVGLLFLHSQGSWPSCTRTSFFFPFGSSWKTSQDYLWTKAAHI